MRDHVPTYFNEAAFKHYAVCSCRKFRTKTHRSNDDAEDEFFKHIEMVERARLHLGTRTPSLKHQRDYYREQADDVNLPANERELWEQLADELDARLNDGERAEADQPRLW